MLFKRLIFFVLFFVFFRVLDGHANGYCCFHDNEGSGVIAKADLPMDDRPHVHLMVLMLLILHARLYSRTDGTFI